MTTSPAKLVIAGPVGAGKTTVIRSLADGEPVSTEMPLTTGPMGDKTTTTVALDFATILLDDGMPVMLYGLPGQDHFGFMRPMLLQGAAGAIVLLDGSDPTVSEQCADWLRSIRSIDPDMALVIGVTKSDCSEAFDIREVRRTLRDSGATMVPIMTIDARDRQQAAHLVRALLVAAASHES